MTKCALCDQEILNEVLKGKVIAIDIGHGWNTTALFDVGAEGNGTTEYELNKATALKSAEHLRTLGAVVHVFDYSNPDMRLTLREKGKRAGTVKADVFISIHHNAFNGQAQGTEVCIDSEAMPEDSKLAKAILVRLVEHLGFLDRGIKQQPLGVLKGCPTSIPACLTEGFFIDAARFKGTIPKETTDAYALGLAIGIKDYLVKA
jgi:N-acetylmuramoyl-L-alanine amidase